MNVLDIPDDVAPHVGAWIEIGLYEKHRGKIKVAPHVGAWIEITIDMPNEIEKPKRRSSCRSVD